MRFYIWVWGLRIMFEFLIAVVALVMAIVAFNKITTLDGKVARLKMQLGQLSDQLEKLRRGEVSNAPPAPAPLQSVAEIKKQPETKPKPKPVVAAAAVKNAPEPVLKSAVLTPKVVEPVKVEPVVAKVIAPVIAPVMAKVPPAPTPPAKPPLPPKAPAPKRDMEQALASRWFVWIGGVAIAIGGLLFVKYAYDNGYISPTLQIILALVLAACLIFAGDRLRRNMPVTKDADYVPAALSASGLAVAFGTIYAAYALYELVPAITAFIGLALVGLGALVLSLRQGPFIAALGLAGSYATPTLITSHNPNAWTFFPYLLIIMVASFAVLRKRPWWWLGYASIAGSAVWSMLWMHGPFVITDVMPLGLFALAFGAVSFFAVSGRASLDANKGSLLDPVGMSPSMQIGTVGAAASSLVLALLVFKTQHMGSALMLFGIGMAAVSALSWFKKGETSAALAAAVLTFFVLINWPNIAFNYLSNEGSLNWSSAIINSSDAAKFLRTTLWAGVAFMALGLLGVFRKSSTLNWSILAVLAPLLFFGGAWARVFVLLNENSWAVLGNAVALVLLVTVALRRTKIAAAPENFAAGILCIGAAGAFMFAADRMFDGVWLTIAIAVLAFGFAFMTRELPVKLLGPISAALGTFTTARLFISRELWLDERALPWGQHWPLYGYGIPVILFWASSRLLKSSNNQRSSVGLEAVSLGLAISLISLELRVLIGGGVTSGPPQLLEASTHILTWLGAAFGLLYRQKLYSSLVSSWGSRILLAMSAVGFVFGSMFILNPVVSPAPLQGGVVFNALLLAYLAPAFLLILVARNLAGLKLERLRPVVECAGVVLAVFYVFMQIKRMCGDAVLYFEPQDAFEWSLHVLSWLGLGSAIAYGNRMLSPQGANWTSKGLLVLSAAGIIPGSMAGYNPVVTQDAVQGSMLLNILWLLYLLPAIILWFISRNLEPLKLERWRLLIEVLAVVLVTLFVTLEIRRIYAGAVLQISAKDEIELALLILAWLGLSSVFFYRNTIISPVASRYSAFGLLLLAGFTLITGALVVYNPAISGMPVQGNAFINSLALLCLAPAIVLWFMTRRFAALKVEQYGVALEALVVVLNTAFVTLELKRLYGGASMELEPRDALEAALLIITWLGLAIVLLYRSGLVSPLVSLWGARMLAGLSCLGIIGGTMLRYNPLLSGDAVQGGVLFNSLALGYLAPVVLLALLLRKMEPQKVSPALAAFGGLALVLGLGYLTLETKRIFQGPVMSIWSQSNAESYTYSAVWLVSGVALFMAGIRVSQKYIRYAGLAVMVLVVLKVFLLDLWQLGGIWPILSLMGLGLCLVGIGWLYSRFLKTLDEKEAAV
jgi:uncharacterized membrane protein